MSEQGEQTPSSRPTMDDLRRAGAWAALAPLAASLSGMRERIALEAETERLTMNLLIVMGDRFGVGMAEVERREELFATARRESISTGERPRIAALKSVLEDATHGRLT